MPVNVLVVDDSAFFRRRIKEILEQNPNIQCIGSADNGVDAVSQAQKLRPDVITMDYEMPRMNGIAAVQEIMAKSPTPILMFSSLTFEGARVTLDALEAGALDYLPKSFESMSGSPGESARILQEKVLELARSPVGKSAKPVSRSTAAPASKPAESKQWGQQPRAKPAPSQPAPAGSAPVKSQEKLAELKRNRPALIAIGASTGGPIALQKVLASLPANFPYPIVLVQHMPSTFTAAFAQRLDRVCSIHIKEAEDGDLLRPGVALLAPGGKQMLLDDQGKSVSIIEGSDKIQFKPSVDVTFGSAARALKGKVLALVLTGMGHDGREGCKLLKREGATVWTQDEATCVVYGMPMSVETAGLSDAVMPIEQFAGSLREIM